MNKPIERLGVGTSTVLGAVVGAGLTADHSMPFANMAAGAAIGAIGGAIGVARERRATRQRQAHFHDSVAYARSEQGKAEFMGMVNKLDPSQDKPVKAIGSQVKPSRYPR